MIMSVNGDDSSELPDYFDNVLLQHIDKNNCYQHDVAEHTMDSGYLTFFSFSLSSSQCCSPNHSVLLPQQPTDIVLIDYEQEIKEDTSLNSAYFSSYEDYEIYLKTKKYIDIFTRLSQHSVFHLINKILSYLSANDIEHCSYVSRNWYNILGKYYFEQNEHKQFKNVKRNLFSSERNTVYEILSQQTPLKRQCRSQLSQHHLHCLFIPTPISINNTATRVSQHHPLHPLTNMSYSSTPVQNSSSSRIPSVNTNDDQNVHPLEIDNRPFQRLLFSPPSTKKRKTYRYEYLKYLHGPTIPKRCPICSYISVVDVNDQHGICSNPTCQNNFCYRCSGPYHPLSPCKIKTGPIMSPLKKRQPISPIFSNKTRTNLKRLALK
ncbi:unnamed protein product [Didymodactylos carnosus]|uniref:ZBR-type domain-containing protein n=1 Tax=Didymodactylos carnosus TaxID=1234261 RepID=A0A814BW35_9BILA|nr:unnamed protein product [Didymodactylos carnosus]CAF0934234.1 unnamed protein product [Didymodactylos carnosus]CAF3709509.1 unnamed protein product [Didymodactylos carnosus]CAF3710155.1 unnamed protein product [Didymodactylos carnosus]